MDIFSVDFIKGNNEILYVAYTMQKNRHSESIAVYYRESGSEDNIKMHYIAEDVPLGSSWMQLMDYDMPDSPHTLDIERRLTDIAEYLPVYIDDDDYVFSEDIQETVKRLKKKGFDKAAKKALEILAGVLYERPSLAFYYPYYYDLMKILYKGVTTSIDKEEADRAADMSRHIAYERQDLSLELERARGYCDEIFCMEGELGYAVNPKNLRVLHLSYAGDDDYYANVDDYITSNRPPKRHSPGHRYTWSEFIEDYKEQINFDDDRQIFYTANNIVRMGIEQMLDYEHIIRTCKLCGGHFHVRYTSSQEYCTRLYGETKIPCNEYASKKSYKERIFKHPINQEFTKAYNKLYGRIRRGKLPADTPLMDQLKKLRDEYYEKYENTHKKDREKVWKEYIEKNKELIS